MKVIEDVYSYLAVTLVGAVLWVVRRVITNQKQIELLQSEIKGREELRQRDREDIQELKRDVKDLIVRTSK